MHYLNLAIKGPVKEQKSKMHLLESTHHTFAAMLLHDKPTDQSSRAIEARDVTIVRMIVTSRAL